MINAVKIVVTEKKDISSIYVNNVKKTVFYSSVQIPGRKISPAVKL